MNPLVAFYQAVVKHKSPPVAMRLLPLFIAGLAFGLAACGPNAFLGVAVTDNVTLKALSYDPATGGLLKATPGGIFRRAKDAEVWQPLSLRGPIPLGGLSDVAVSWNDPQTILASGNGAGVYKTTDGGRTWTPSNTGLPDRRVSSVATHTQLPATAYVFLEGQGVYKTEDGASSWKRMDAGPPTRSVGQLVHSSLPGSMNTGWLYAATPDGLYLSMDCF